MANRAADVSKREEIIMIANQRGGGAHLLDALWLCALGDVTNLRRLRLQCRNSGQKIADHEISEMIEYLGASETKRRNDGAGEAVPVINQIVREDDILEYH